MSPLPKFTRIISTLGPASSDEETIARLIQVGANCFRLNFSHGDGPALQPLIERIRAVAAREGQFIPILADIQGPKLRMNFSPPTFAPARKFCSATVLSNSR
jgi:pyruvate kinase